jgi:hypothetical protein
MRTNNPQHSEQLNSARFKQQQQQGKLFAEEGKDYMDQNFEEEEADD